MARGRGKGKRRRPSQQVAVAKKAKVNTVPAPQRVKAAAPSATIYNVEDIVDKAMESDGTWKYCVKWVDWPSSSNTWEPIANLLPTCKDMLEEFDEEWELRQENCNKLDKHRAGTSKKKVSKTSGKKPALAKAEPISPKTLIADKDGNYGQLSLASSSIENMLNITKLPNVVAECSQEIPGDSAAAAYVTDDETLQEMEAFESAEKIPKVTNIVNLGAGTIEEGEFDELTADLLEECSIFEEFPKGRIPNRIISVVPYGNHLIYYVDLKKDGVEMADFKEKVIFIIGTTFKHEYPDLLINYYENNIVWLRDGPAVAVEPETTT